MKKRARGMSSIGGIPTIIASHHPTNGIGGVSVSPSSHHGPTTNGIPTSSTTINKRKRPPPSDDRQALHKSPPPSPRASSPPTIPSSPTEASINNSKDNTPTPSSDMSDMSTSAYMIVQLYKWVWIGIGGISIIAFLLASLTIMELVTLGALISSLLSLVRHHNASIVRYVAWHSMIIILTLSYILLQCYGARMSNHNNTNTTSTWPSYRADETLNGISSTITLCLVSYLMCELTMLCRHSQWLCAVTIMVYVLSYSGSIAVLYGYDMVMFISQVLLNCKDIVIFPQIRNNKNICLLQSLSCCKQS
jgi:hypothetical protein